MKNALRIICTLLILPLASSPLLVYAQETRGPDPLVVSVTPEAPSPGEETTITLTSSSLDLSRAQFTWKLNNVTKSSGPARRSFTFAMGSGSGTTAVSVTITPLGGATISRTFTFHPGSVNLVWEANTYTPPFYRGKALYTPGADVRIVAIPDIREGGSAVPASALTYRWSVDDEPFADRSGLGRDTFYLSGAQLLPDQTVAVDVLRQNGIRAAHAEVTIPKNTPMLRFYKRDPLRGALYSRAYSDTVQLADTETTLLAEPYFISGTVREPERVLYTWTLNDTEVQPQGKERAVLTLRQTAGQSGFAKLSLTLQNADLRRLLQQASQEITLVFGTQTQ
jgi:hypothetical protein